MNTAQSRLVRRAGTGSVLRVTFLGWNIDDVEIQAVEIMLPGDFDDDGLIDLDDHAAFVPCQTGPNGGLNPGCERTDLDLDNDTDLYDWHLFQSAIYPN